MGEGRGLLSKFREQRARCVSLFLWGPRVTGECGRVLSRRQSAKATVRADPLACIRGGTRTATDFPYHSVVLSCHPLASPHRLNGCRPSHPRAPSLLVPSNGRTSDPPLADHPHPFHSICAFSVSVSLHRNVFARLLSLTLPVSLLPPVYRVRRKSWRENKGDPIEEKTSLRF